VEFDDWGIAHEPGSEAAYHMTRMRHPMADFKSLEQMEAYPFPDFESVSMDKVEQQVMKYHPLSLVWVCDTIDFRFYRGWCRCVESGSA